MYPRIAGAQSVSPLSADSRCLFHLDCADTRVDAMTGALLAITEHRGAFTRGSQTQAATDATAMSYTAQYAQPAWASRNWPPVGELDPQPALGLELGLYDRVAFPYQAPWQPHRGRLLGIETGARILTNACLFAITSVAGTGPGLWLDSTGVYYRLTVTDGTTTAVATLPGGGSVSGDRLAFEWQLDASGFVHVALLVGKTVPAQRAVSASAITYPTSVASDLAVRLNSRTPTTYGAQQWFRSAKLVAGNPDPLILAGIR